MSVQRFIAPTSREAMAKARMAFGDSAVILSSRTTDQGFEVLASAEEDLTDLAGPAAAPAPRVNANSSRPAFSDRVAEQASRTQLSQSSVAQDTETMAMSTLSFQEYVRERMLRKRREAMGAQAPATPSLGMAAATAPTHEAPPVSRPVWPQAQATHQAAGLAQSLRPQPAPVSRVQPVAPTPASPSEQGLASELQSLKAMIEDRFNTLAWLGQSRQSPLQSQIMHKLIRAGYSPTVARAVLERMPADFAAGDAFRWVQQVLARNIKVSDNAGTLSDEGGIFALIGATGVGKTTTAAKLAAQCVKSYGAHSVGLITLDAYRIAGYDQLRTLGRMLGVVAHLAHDAAALQDLLGLLANKRMVIIDTAGFSQRDPRIQEMLEILASPAIKKMLVINASSHGDTMDDVLTAYRVPDLYGVVLSKTDEAVKLGPALDAMIRHQVVLRGLCTGQRVPEDWERADAQFLVKQSMGSHVKSAHDPDASELGFFFAQSADASVKLDTHHV